MNPLNYSYVNATNKHALIVDSSFYNVRHGGIEEINVNNYNANYKWAGHYPVRAIVADTGNTYVFLKDNDLIGRFNYNSQKYESIWPDSLNKNIRDIDVGSNGYVWAAISGYPREIAMYDGNSWMFFPFNENLYNGFTGINLVNDSLAYLSSGSVYFFSLQNGVYDTLYINNEYYIRDWDVTTNGSIWAAAGSNLIHINDGIVNLYDSTNTPIGTDEFLHVKIGTDGHIWTCGSSNHLYEFDGSSWVTYTYAISFAFTENFTLNENNEPYVIVHNYYGRKLLSYIGNTWYEEAIPFWPLNNTRVIGLKTDNNDYGYFAEDGGFFIIGLSNNSIHNYIDSSDFQQAKNVTCFTDNDPTNLIPTFGSNNGVGSLSGFDNSLLPSLQVNHICYDNGTYYIATDSGLVAYNGILYNNINTSNSPLPSDKITFVTTGNLNYCNNYGGLFIGTDKGVGIYRNGQWTIFDTTNIPINNFNVTGILPPCWSDEDIYISTFGSGLLKVDLDGEYEFFNTTLGNFEDDSLHYVKYLFLGECGDFIIIGTNNHGIAYTENWNAGNFYYADEFNGIPLEKSTMAANGYYCEINLIATDTMYFIASFCGSITENKSNKQLKWIQQGNQLNITVPETLYGKGEIELIDIVGRTIIENQVNINNEKLILDISELKAGIYIFRLINGNRMGYSKVLISN
jgi:hypothetical protein